MLFHAVASYVERRKYGVWRRLQIWHERQCGVDITPHHSVRELGLSPLRSVNYANSGTRYLRHVLSHLPITPQDGFYDFGCGKGGVLIAAAQHAYGLLGGVELSERLYPICLENLRKLRVGAVVTRADAADIHDLDDYTHFYFFNPFPELVMQQVLTNILESLAARPRAVTLIYKNPVCHTSILRTRKFRHFVSFPADWGMVYTLYHNDQV